jgi:hypothetical protein
LSHTAFASIMSDFKGSFLFLLDLLTDHELGRACVLATARAA